MSETKAGVQELREATEKLLALLQDPHPGLYTWNEALIARLDEVARWSPHFEVLTERVTDLERRLDSYSPLSTDSALRCEQVGRTLNEKDEPDFDSPEGNVEWEHLK